MVSIRNATSDMHMCGGEALFGLMWGLIAGTCPAAGTYLEQVIANNCKAPLPCLPVAGTLIAPSLVLTAAHVRDLFCLLQLWASWL